MSGHPELPLEQRYVDRAYLLLEKGLADAEVNLGEFQTQYRSTAQAIQRALRILKESRGTGQLVFGKVSIDGEDRYVGRRRVRDEAFEPVVVGWHAPAAQIFYDASPEDPHGVSLKRIFAEEERRLVRVLDEIVAGVAGDASAGERGVGTFSDALLEELNRSRDGAMREVVATIQREQFRTIRNELAGCTVVQGGPGTGKTVVGLHRAAWLAFNHAELQRSGVLVVTPSKALLTYVSGVLPSLDVTGVDQADIQSLYAGDAVVSGTESVEATRVKGSGQMAELLARALASRVGFEDEALDLALGADRIVLKGDEVRALVKDVATRDLSHSDQRELLRGRLASLVVERHREDQQAAGRPVRANEATIRRLTSFANALDRIWPTYTPEEFLRTLYSTQSWLVAAAEGLISAEERARLFRQAASTISSEPWSEPDLYCLDELAHLLNRDTVTYGHVVVDEAQDLSPMQARALLRRCPTGSFTVLGDLAQASGVWVRDSWAELTQHLGAAEPTVMELTVGYRVPASVLELAAQQLPLMGPGLEPPRSIRTGVAQPRFEATDPVGLEPAVLSAVESLRDQDLSVGVLVPDGQYERWRRALPAAGDGADGDFSQAVTVVPCSSARGLEFDAVLLVEPAAIAAEAVQPPRSLYVAMTRCTQTLVVVHSVPLPAGLPGGAGPTSAALSDEAGDRPAPLEVLADRIALLSETDRAVIELLVERLLRADDNEVPR